MSQAFGITIALIFALVLLFTVTYSSQSDYSDQHPILDQVRDNFALLDPKFKEIPLRNGNSAFTENKRVITLCLVNPETGNYYDMNTIMYVALHELAHVVSKKHGHGEEFKANFAELLRRAAKKGIYDPRKPIPMTYCGIGPDDG